MELQEDLPFFAGASWNNVALKCCRTCLLVRAQLSCLSARRCPMFSDVGISESTPLPIPPLPVSWFQLPFEAAYQKTKQTC